MQIRAIKAYIDTVLDRKVASGEMLDATTIRGKYLISIGYAEKVKNHNIYVEEENA